MLLFAKCILFTVFLQLIRTGYPNTKDLFHPLITLNYSNCLQLHQPLFSPNNKLASVLCESLIILFDAETGQQYQQLDNKLNVRNTYYDFSKDSKRIYVGTETNDLIVWESREEGEGEKEGKGMFQIVRVKKMSGFTPYVVRVTWDSKYLILSGKEGIYLYHQSNLTEYKTLQKNYFAASIQLFHQYNSIIISSVQMGAAFLTIPIRRMVNYSDITFEPMSSIILTAQFYSVHMSHSASMAFMKPQSKNISIYDNTTRGQLARLSNGHTDGITGTTFSCNDNYIITAGLDRLLIVWKTKTFLEHSRYDTELQVTGMKVSRDFRRVLICSESRVAVWAVGQPGMFGTCGGFGGEEEGQKAQRDGGWMLMDLIYTMGIVGEVALGGRIGVNVLTLLQGIALIGWTNGFDKITNEQIEFGKQLSYTYLNFKGSQKAVMAYGIVANAKLCLVIYLIATIVYLSVFTIQRYWKRNHNFLKKLQQTTQNISLMLCYPLIFFSLASTMGLPSLSPPSYPQQLKGCLIFTLLLLPLIPRLFTKSFPQLLICSLFPIYMYFLSTHILSSPTPSLMTSWFCLIHSAFVLTCLFISVWLTDKRLKSKYSTVVIVLQAFFEVVSVIAYLNGNMFMVKLFTMLGFMASVMGKWMLRRVERARGDGERKLMSEVGVVVVGQHSSVEIQEMSSVEARG